MWLPISRRCSQQAAKGPAQQSIPVLLSGAGASSPASKHRSAAKRSRALNAAMPGSSPSYATGIMERGGGKNKKPAIARKSAGETESQQDEKKERRKEEVRMSLTLRNTVPIPDCGIFRRQLWYYNKPPSYPWYRRATPAGSRQPGQPH